MYPEVGSSYKSAGYSDNGADGYHPTRRSYDNSNDYYRDDYRNREGDGARDSRHHHHNERPHTNRDLTRNPEDRNNNNNRTRDDREKNRRNSTGNSSNNNNNSNSNSNARLWERVLPPDFRPSQANPDERRRRRLKEKDCEGFDWTPGIVLGLLGAAALFNYERSLVRRRKKEYIER
ncbi:hypothetical protein A9Z42_0020480 [Trichoderma parareesei]|uniref:Uncharacterized protein n=1 Tax=Trichoderma parareesei TaxID=858221 RepID=A0A2H2ZQX9_TRIPA|nr:hypothetical protein A9Z42_0020480 [Trichoderma parareesei]